MRKKRLLLLILVLVKTVFINAQKNWNTELFIKQIQDKKISKNDSLSINEKSGFISYFEFRTETDEFLLNQQQYQLRIAPVSFALKKSKQKYLEVYKEKENIKKNEASSTILFDYYSDWLRLFEETKLLKIYKDLEKNLSDQHFIILQELENGADYGKALEKERELQLIRLTIHNLQNSINFLKNYYNLSDKNLSFDDLISIQNIKQILNDPQNLSFLNEKIIEESKLKEEIIEREIAVEKAERNRYFDFLQLEYAGPEQLALEKKLAVGISLFIPISDNKKTKIKELQIEKDRVSFENTLENELIKKSLKGNLNKLLYEIESYQNFKEFEQKMTENSGKISDFFQNKTVADITRALEIKEQSLYTNLEEIQLQLGVLKNYLLILNQANVLDFERGYKLLLNQPFSMN